MKSNKEILDKFGELLINGVFDNQISFINNSVVDLAKTKGYQNLFTGMNQDQKSEIEFYTKELLKGCLFDTLKIFEENDQFKLIYEEDGKQVDLNKISEMLKAEPIIEGGWIERFSKELNK